MFDIGWSEMLVIAAVAIIVVGPRELPGMLRTFGKYMGQIRRMAGEFQSQFNDALKEAELDEVRRGIESVRSASPARQLRKELTSTFKDAGDGVRKAVEDPAAPKQQAAEKSEAACEAASGETPPSPPPAKGPVEGTQTAEQRSTKTEAAETAS